MIVEPVAHIPGLYLVSEVYNPALLDRFLAEDQTQWPRGKLEQQDHLLRSSVRYFAESSFWKLVQNSLDHEALAELGLAYKDSVCWLDEPGFSIGMHTDNEGVFAAMQVYLTDGPESHGTHFIADNKIFVVPYKKNCGYVMINKKQYHGIPLACEFARVSTYTWLESKS